MTGNMLRGENAARAAAAVEEDASAIFFR